MHVNGRNDRDNLNENEKEKQIEIHEGLNNENARSFN